MEIVQQVHSKLPAPEKIGRLTTDQYFEMIRQGIIREGAPYELLDGLLVLKDRSTHGEDIMSIGGPHNLTVSLLIELNPLLKPRGCYIQVQGPVRIPPLHAPEPDGAIVKGTPRDYPTLQCASDVICIIEAADSSLETDRTDKGAKYAEAEIPQFILVDLIHRLIEVREGPQQDKTQIRKVPNLEAGTKGRVPPA